MPKEYRTIQEVAGPLMLVRGVEDVTYDELGEIELANGEKRRCRVLEIDGSNALVQLYESATGINLSNSNNIGGNNTKIIIIDINAPLASNIHIEPTIPIFE